MKKILLTGCFLLLTACRPASPTPATSLFPTATPPPTSVPATVTPGPTPTLEFTATPFPRLFTDEFEASLAGWVILQAGSEAAAPNIKNENSNLILQMDSPYNWVYALYGAQDYDDIRVDAQFTNQAGSPASIGLICRYSEADGWFEYNISTDGTYNVLYGQWLANGIADYLPVVSASSGAIQPSGASQEIGLVCSGTTLSLFIDQTLIRNMDVSRFELTQGKIGITASSFENAPVVAAFNWVKVSEP
ncbi:MAG: hypothetical protein EHM40_15145 [Chloroflexi bacterium]|nr:MAG: hypothetical protein EHM40_15145 [Chloroflexota bacterium]